MTIEGRWVIGFSVLIDQVLILLISIGSVCKTRLHRRWDFCLPLIERIERGVLGWHLVYRSASVFSSLGALIIVYLIIGNFLRHLLL